MKKSLLAFALALGLAGSAFAQTPAADDARIFGFKRKVAQLDVLIQVVPLDLTKAQIGPILSAIEKVRQNDKTLSAQEAKDLAQYEDLVAKAVDNGIEKNVYPPRELQTKILAFNRAVGMRRSLFVNDSVDLVFAACKANLNEGQLKVMEKSLKPELLDPSIKVAEMDSDAKVKFFIRKVLLDPIAYDVLVDMTKRTEEPEKAPTTP